MSFDKPYVFKVNNNIGPNGKFLRIDPKHEGNANPEGGKGKFAQWHIEKVDGNYQFKNKHSGRYLRLKGNNDIDVNGTGGAWCKFKAHVQDKQHIRKLESVSFKGKYIAVRNGKVVYGTGGPFCKFQFFRN